MAIVGSKTFRLRAGIILWLVSWIPVAQIVVAEAHNNGKLQSEKATSLARLAIWSVQILIGILGLWLVGQLAVATAKKEGWKKAPKNLWHLFLHGADEDPKIKTDTKSKAKGS